MEEPRRQEPRDSPGRVEEPRWQEPQESRDREEPPFDRILFRSDLLTIGSFRARPDHPRFHDSGPIRRHVFVFPRTRVLIRHEGCSAFATDTRVRTRMFLAERFAEPLTLEEIATHAGVSVFHLCRSFRRWTGTTVHRYRNELRLRRSLEPVAEGCELTRVALEHGYSSHSHFTAAFRKAFGVTPSAFRASASSRRIRELAARLGRPGGHGG